jgi:hypothetical protein
MSDLELTMMRRVGELKAEVERLTLENSQYEEHHKYGQNVITSLREEVDNSKRINTELLVLSNRQASDIRRLTKAGDTLLSEWASGDEKDAQNFLKALTIWNAAKEGKPSA